MVVGGVFGYISSQLSNFDLLLQVTLETAVYDFPLAGLETIEN